MGVEDEGVVGGDFISGVDAVAAVGVRVPARQGMVREGRGGEGGIRGADGVGAVGRGAGAAVGGEGDDLLAAGPMGIEGALGVGRHGGGGGDGVIAPPAREPAVEAVVFPCRDGKGAVGGIDGVGGGLGGARSAAGVEGDGLLVGSPVGVESAGEVGGDGAFRGHEGSAGGGGEPAIEDVAGAGGLGEGTVGRIDGVGIGGLGALAAVGVEGDELDVGMPMGVEGAGGVGGHHAADVHAAAAVGFGEPAVEEVAGARDVGGEGFVDAQDGVGLGGRAAGAFVGVEGHGLLLGGTDGADEAEAVGIGGWPNIPGGGTAIVGCRFP